eukprot:1670591-Alexandrium_andersonii.AAC.1
MSASLVGSEMCIRDRTSCSTHNQAGSTQPPLGDYQSLAPKVQQQVAEGTCLLYTSDAADDM